MKQNIAAILLLLFMPLALHAQNKIVIFANNFEPYYGENLPNYGPFLAIVQTALERAGYETQIEFLPWARIIAEAERGQCDVIAGVWFNKGRETWLALSNPVLSNELGLLKLKDNLLRFTDLESLARQGIVVGNVAGYINPPSVEKAGVKVEYVTTDLLNLKSSMRGWYMAGALSRASLKGMRDR
jgi:polar amino acid transport system substrate-binding protein